MSDDFDLRKLKELEQEENFKHALTSAKDLFHLKDPPIQGSNALEKALLVLGKKQGIEFVFPQGGDLTSILERSEIRFRKVILSPGWEKKYVGPLLCFQKGVPIAYLGQKIRPDPIAYMLYPPLPQNADSGKSLVSFLLKSHKSLTGSLGLYGLIASLIAFLPPIATSLLFKYAVPLSDLSLVNYLFLGLLFSAIGLVTFSFLRNFCFLRLEALVDHFLQSALWDRLLLLSPSFFRKISAGALFWKMFSISRIRQLIQENSSYRVLNGFFAFFYLLIMATYSPTLTVITAALALSALGTTLLLIQKKAKFLAKEIEVQEELQGMVVQMIGGIGKLRTTKSEKNAFAHFLKRFTKAKNCEMRAQNIQNAVATYATALPVLSMWLVYFTLIEVIGIKNLPLSDFLGFSIALSSFSIAIYPLNVTLISLAGVYPLWKQAKGILKETPEESREKILPKQLTGKVHIDEVFFSYGSAPALENVSIEVQPGEFIGIVGSSGSGKSTLLRLLLGFETPKAGAVYFDDQDLNHLNARAVRKQIGTVLQTSGLLSGTIYENIVGGGFYTPEEIKRAVFLAGFQEDLTSFPMGLHTYISADGATLSGGQKQRLLLARALVGSPSILILDEATSSLDNRTQTLVTKNIQSLGVTRIVVAQRLSTIRHADRIYCIEGGSVVQIGTFEELRAQSGLFKEMLDRQKL